MDFDLPADDDPRRLAVRTWLAEHPDPSGEDLHAAGYIVPHWPEPYGLNADPLHQVIIDDELRRAEIGPTATTKNAIGVGWAAPTIYLAGSDWQKERFLKPIFENREHWCQLFSEPDAGSDLASLRTSAVRDGDEYVINGSKVWTSSGHHAQFGILIARTDPDAPKHKGISYFILPMDLPGVTMTPIIDMTTAHSFNQVFFDNVRLPAKYLVGAENDGWRLAKVTLSNERVSLSSAGTLWGSGPTTEMLFELIRDRGGISSPVLRQQAAQVYIESEILRLGRLRTLSARLKGNTPGVEASVQKIMADEHGQNVMALAQDIVGADAMLEGSGPAGVLPPRMRQGATEVNRTPQGDIQFPDVDPVWHYGFIFSPALTIGGGTWAIQRNIVAEQVLGLPREPLLQQNG